MKGPRIIVALVLAGALVWGGYLAWRAHRNLVTLHVRNMEVRQVISKIEWQTWERILVNKGVNGMITLDVDSVPLDEVLNIITLQTSSRWTALYPIYAAGKSVVSFKKVVRGDIAPEGSGWTNLARISQNRLGNVAGFGNMLRSQNKLVSAQIQSKDLAFTTLALSRFSQAQIVPEDGAAGTINLKLDQVPFEKAVAQVARQVRRKWDQLYALHPSNGQLVVKQEKKSTDDPAAPPKVVVKTDVVREENSEREKRDMEAFLATMTPEERVKAQEQMTAMEQIRSLPPAEQQQQMQQMAAQAAQAKQAGIEERISSRLKNGTIAQRIAHDRQTIQKQRPEK